MIFIGVGQELIASLSATWLASAYPHSPGYLAIPFRVVSLRRTAYFASTNLSQQTQPPRNA